MLLLLNSGGVSCQSQRLAAGGSGQEKICPITFLSICELSAQYQLDDGTGQDTCLTMFWFRFLGSSEQRISYAIMLRKLERNVNPSTDYPRFRDTLSNAALDHSVSKLANIVWRKTNFRKSCAIIFRSAIWTFKSEKKFSLTVATNYVVC